MRYINLTPHSIALNDGTTFPASGTVARVEAAFIELPTLAAEGIPAQYSQVLGKPAGLPKAKKGVRYIVSAMVFGATRRKDVVAPATGHHDCRRNENGQIVSVPGFIVKGV